MFMTGWWFPFIVGGLGVGSVFASRVLSRRLSSFVVVSRRLSSFVVVCRRLSSFVVVSRRLSSFVVVLSP